MHTQHPSGRLRFGIAALIASLVAVATAEAQTAADQEALPAVARVASKVKAAGTESGDWPVWRGPNYDGKSPATDLPESWDPDGENLVWKNEALGTRSAPVAMNGKLYLLARDNPGTQNEGEKVVCADAATGEIQWEYRFNVFLSDVPDTRVAWSNVVADPTSNKVYAQGVCGLFICLDAETGKPVWERSLSEEFGLLTTYGGRTNIPIMFEDVVIISGIMINWGEYAKPEHRFLGLDKLTGEVQWFAGTKPLPADTSYSMPVPCVLNGQAAIVFGAGDGYVYAMQPRTGKMIWKYRLSMRGLNCTPLVVDNVVYMGQTEENIEDNSMGAIVAIDGTGTGDITKTGTIWKKLEMAMGRSSPVLVDGVLYCALDSGKLKMFNAKTGDEYKLDRRNEILGTIQRASILYADAKLYVGEANGRFHIFKLGEKPDEIKKTLPPRGLQLDGEIHGSPFVAYGRLYVPTTECLYCIDQGEPQPGSDPAAKLPVEQPLTDKTPAQLQLIPAEHMMTTGGSQPYRVKLYNAAGQFLKDVPGSEVEFTLDKGGKMTPEGVFKAATTKPVGVHLTAKVGDLTGNARVRLFPKLPWKYDFASGEIPEPWIGIRYRHQIRDLDGNPVMVKVTTIPKGTRSQGWIGPIELSNYTVQANVQGKYDKRLPDVGLIAQRYRLDLLGASQEIQIYSWISHEIKFTKKPFAWKPDVWYTMKLQASVEDRDGKEVAVLRGKVWPRDEQEPAEWTIERVDEMPDTAGAPGLFGNAKDAEILIDNLQVYPNKPGPVAAVGAE